MISVSRLKLALWQTGGVSGDPAANLAALAIAAKAYAALGADLLLCPELWLCGYNIPESLVVLAEPADGPSACEIARIAAESGIAIVYGFAEQDAATGGIYNSVQAVGGDGKYLALYRKTHLFGPMEKAVFTPGDRIAAPFEYLGWRIGLLICFDIEFPEPARSLALAGVDLLLVPTAQGLEFRAVCDILVPARALENGIFVAYCDRCGIENGLPYIGESRVVAPDGSIIAAAGATETILLADLDPVLRHATRSIVDYLPQRRAGLYAP